MLPRTHLARFRSGILARFGWSTCRPAVAGGRERQDSVAAGLRALPEDIEYVVIHDGARPFATTALVERVLAAARRHGAALAAVPVHDTIKRVSPDLFLDGTVDRRALWLAQTPQAFSVGLLREAHAQARAAGLEATDDAALVEALGHPVRVVPGSRLNFKITTREDLTLARMLIGRAAEMRCHMVPRVRAARGAGREPRPRAARRHGVRRPPLRGRARRWSSAASRSRTSAVWRDTPTPTCFSHAICDALLGAAALGDIGRHFPDRDPAFRGISSLELLRRTVAILAAAGWAPLQVDTLHPRRGPAHRAARAGHARGDRRRPRHPRGERRRSRPPPRRASVSSGDARASPPRRSVSSSGPPGRREARDRGGDGGGRPLRRRAPRDRRSAELMDRAGRLHRRRRRSSCSAGAAVAGWRSSAAAATTAATASSRRALLKARGAEVQVVLVGDPATCAPTRAGPGTQPGPPESTSPSAPTRDPGCGASARARRRPGRRRAARHRLHAARPRASRRRRSASSTRLGRPVLAVDLPSGLAADHGRVGAARRSAPRRP